MFGSLRPSRSRNSFLDVQVRRDANFDIYNAFNSDAVLTEQTAYSGANGGAWLLPTTVLQGRIIKFGVRWDF